MHVVPWLGWCIGVQQAGRDLCGAQAPDVGKLPAGTYEAGLLIASSKLVLGKHEREAASGPSALNL